MTGVRIEILDTQGNPIRMFAGNSCSLTDICDAHGGPVEFSCRAASCSTCRVEVLAGDDLLTPPAAMERELLTALGSPAHIRFCCTAELRRGAQGELRLRALGPAF